jgi:integrase
MQSQITREHRTTVDVWTYRWRNPDADGNVVRHRLVLATVAQFPNEEAVKQTFAGTIRAINSDEIRVQTTTMTVAQLITHYRQHELSSNDLTINSSHITDVDEKRFSTIDTYEGYLRNWVLPRWGECVLSDVKTIHLENWLMSLRNWRDANLHLAPGTRAKIRAVMKTLFNHARRYELFHRNPVTLVRQRGRRRKTPLILTIQDIRTLLAALDFREFVMVFLAATTGLRLSELFALQWQDIDFETLRIRVNRSIVKQRVGSCKTEASQDAIPLPPETAVVLHHWRARAIYSGQFDWIFASSHTQGKRPYWGAPIMRKKIKPIARKCGIPRLQGWHTFRHTYASLLHELGTNLKIVQELMRHRTIRTTLDGYVHAVTPSKRKAQKALLKRLCLLQGRSTFGMAGNEGATS